MKHSRTLSPIPSQFPSSSSSSINVDLRSAVVQRYSELKEPWVRTLKGAIRYRVLLLSIYIDPAYASADRQSISFQCSNNHFEFAVHSPFPRTLVISAMCRLLGLGSVGAIFACLLLPLLPAITWQLTRDSNRDAHSKTCRELPGANDVFVVFKTGSTEFAHKFPVHLNTTLRCYPNYMVFSDHHEVYQGQTIHDALEPLEDHMKRHHRLEFELYHRVKEGGRRILDAAELSDRPDTNRHKKPIDSYFNVGWRLDKWKFLPMFETAYALFLST